MSGYSGFYQHNGSFLNNYDYHYSLLEGMWKTQHHRGNAADGLSLAANYGIAHNHFSAEITKPFSRSMYGKTFLLAFAGELYNTKELKADLVGHNFSFETNEPEEIILCGFIHYGCGFFEKLNGVFSFALIEQENDTIHLVRDSFGCKPLFYADINGTLIFGTELKALLAHPYVKPVIGKTGLNEIFSLGPARSIGCGVFENISEVKPGHYVCYSPAGLFEKPYWKLHAIPHEDSYEDTIGKTHFLVSDAVYRQCEHCGSIGSLLSGGVDSSVVTAVAAPHLASKKETLKSFSFEYTDNKEYFQSNSFQPSLDRPYVDIMAEALHTNHKYLECSQETLFDALKGSVLAHDLPAMADIDSSLLYFCKAVKTEADVVLTGECADEVFGGYPWFHRENMLVMDTFPWTPSLAPRKELLKQDFMDVLQMEDYVQNAYYNTLKDIEYLPCESDTDKAKRRNGYLSLYWFMTTLLNRMERCSAQADLTARVPFADRRLAEYIYNAPWDMKQHNGVIKNLLREAFRGVVPEEVLFRKKSPYPKTYHPAYENLLKKSLKEIITDTASPLRQFANEASVLAFIDAGKDYGSPWYGQLMAGPQMMAYLIQIDMWMKAYDVKVTL